MPSRAQRLQAEMDASTAAGSYDLDRLMASPERDEDFETDSVASLEDEVEAATKAAFSGDLNLTKDEELANLQQPADPSSSSALPPHSARLEEKILKWVKCVVEHHLTSLSIFSKRHKTSPPFGKYKPTML